MFAAGYWPFTILINDVSGGIGDGRATCHWLTAREAIGIVWSDEAAGATSRAEPGRSGTSRCDDSAATFAKRSLDPTCEVVSDGLACFGAVADAWCAHQVVKTRSGAAAARTPAFKWVNTALGNIKAAIVGTYRAIHEKHVPRYLAEFECRFNRRYDLAARMPQLAWAGVRTTPMPYRLLKLADVMHEQFITRL